MLIEVPSLDLEIAGNGFKGEDKRATKVGCACRIADGGEIGVDAPVGVADGVAADTADGVAVDAADGVAVDAAFV